MTTSLPVPHCAKASNPNDSNNRHDSITVYEPKAENQSSTLKDSSIPANHRNVEPANTQQQIWLTSLLSGTIVIMLTLLYYWQRQKVKVKAMTLRLKEKENDYLLLLNKIASYATIDKILTDYITHLPLPEGMKIEYTQTEEKDWGSIPKETTFEVYRIVQEAISNSIRHSHATKIVVSLTCKGNLLGISVEDNGTGFDKARIRKGIGIRTITERAKDARGMVRLETNENGTAIKAMFVI